MRINYLELAIALLSGRAGPAWAARAARSKNMLKTVLGETPPLTPEVPFSPPSGAALGVAIGTGRTTALVAAAELFDALAMRRFDRATKLLGPELVVLWPSGELRRHETGALLTELAARTGKPAPVQASKPRTYTLAELKSVLPRGIPEALDAVLELRTGLLVTLQIDTVRGPIGRVMLAMGPDEEGGWRARSLLLGAPDDAHLASAVFPTPDGESLRMVDQVVRKIVLGQAGQIQGHRSQLMEQLWIGDLLATPDQLIRMVGNGPPKLAGAEVVFLGAEAQPIAKADAIAPPGAMLKIKKSAPDVFGESLVGLAPELILVRLGRLDAASNKVEPGKMAAAIVIQAPDPATEKRRPRIGALFV